jgi:hypothetical protein
MEYKIVKSSTASGLAEVVNMYIADGFKPIGSHQVVTTRELNRFRGSQHADTLIDNEYSQTMVKGEQ